MTSRIAARPRSLPARITSNEGAQKLVKVESNMVTLSQEAILTEAPGEHEIKHAILIAGNRDLGRGGQTSSTCLHEMAIKYEDGSRSTIVGMAGCIMSYSEPRIAATQRNYAKAKESGPSDFNPLYGISTVTIGVPQDRYKNIASRIRSAFGLNLDIDLEVVQNGYVWVDASIDMPKVPTEHPDHDDFDEKYQYQVGYSTHEGLFALGPVYSCLRDLKCSFKVVFFGNMRLKATAKSGETPRSFKLGMTLKTAQLYDISDISAPSNTEKTEKGLYAQNFPASDRLMGVFAQAEAEAEQTLAQESPFDNGADIIQQEEGVVYEEEGEEFVDHPHVEPQFQ